MKITYDKNGRLESVELPFSNDHQRIAQVINELEEQHKVKLVCVVENTYSFLYISRPND